MSEPNDQPLASRLRQFRELAAEALAGAARAQNPYIRREYETIARAWEQLIKEIEVFERER